MRPRRWSPLARGRQTVGRSEGRGKREEESEERIGKRLTVLNTCHHCGQANEWMLKMEISEEEIIQLNSRAA